MTMTETENVVVGKKYRVKVNPGTGFPSERSLDEEHVGVKASDTSTYWCLVWPAVDGDAYSDNWGWNPAHYLSDSEVESVGLGTDWRGWYVHDSNVEVLGEYEEPIAPDIDPARRIAQLEAALERERTMSAELSTELTRARGQRDRWSEQTREAEVRYEQMIERIQTEGEREAREHGWCGAYDQIMERLGLQGREREWRVAVRLTWDTYVTVSARSADDAENYAEEMELLRNWRPPSPFESYTHDGVQDLEFEVREVEEVD
jgi:hypothetical protein